MSINLDIGIYQEQIERKVKFHGVGRREATIQINFCYRVRTSLWGMIKYLLCRGVTRKVCAQVVHDSAATIDAATEHAMTETYRKLTDLVPASEIKKEILH